MHKVMSVTICLFSLLALVVSACAASQVATQPPTQAPTQAPTAPPAKATPAPTTPPAKATPAPSAKPAWQDDWDKTLAEAKKEGTVVVYTQYGAQWRAAMNEAMTRKYGITVDVLTATSGEISQRVMKEQNSKTYQADAVIIGASEFQVTFQPAGVLQSFEKDIIQPEVVDTKAWWTGGLHWVDPDTKSYLQFYDYVTPTLVINSDLVKPGEIKSWKDLLSPRWKGAMVSNDPTVSGNGITLMTMFAFGLMDWNYVTDLSKQELMFSRDNRLMTEWVARGKYPIVLAPHTETTADFIKSGAPLVYITAVEGTYSTPGSGNLSRPKGSPHPNAAKIFANFLLTKEGQTLSSKATGHQSARVAVPTDGLNPAIIRQPGAKYFSNTDPEFMKKSIELKNKVTDLFKPLLK